MSDPAAGRAGVGGWCDPAFGAVREAFAENFAGRGETGAGLAVWVAGRPVVDLWGGHADRSRSRPWGPDTLVNVFSVGKALVALLAARLVASGRLSFDAPVARGWPEFARGGKSEVTLRQLLSHQAGLPAVRRRLAPGAMFDWEVMTSALAEQAPWWEPGTAHGYHTNTFGFLVGEVIRRADGRPVGEVLRDDLAGPLGADVFVGLPAAEDARVADFVWPGEPPPEREPDGLDDEELMRFNTYFNPSGLSGLGAVNARAWRAAEIPSTNGHATARGVARVYAALAAGGSIDGVEVIDPDTLATATREEASGVDRVLGRPSRFGLGFQLTQPERPLGPNPGAFGHFGAGGSLGFCDPDAEVAFGYVTNQMGERWQNPRNRALIQTLYETLA